MNQRIHSLDQLRGLMAFTIMIYHYGSWGALSIPEAVAPAVDLLGIYGVSIFYVLSGAALYFIYSSKDEGPRWIVSYAVKRVLRIAPLLWAATILTIGMAAAAPDTWKMFLNFTLLFGFLAPDAYIATGAWSIGNEVVFYAAFPILIALTRSRAGWVAVLLVAFGLSTYFSMFLLTPNETLRTQWSTYINPLNQIHLFVAGMVVGATLRRWNAIPAWVSVGGAVAVAALILAIGYCYSEMALITGWQRHVLSVLCALLCLFVGLHAASPRGVIAGMFSTLGAISYSVYLLHPVVFRCAKYLGLHIQLGDYFAPMLIAGVLVVSFCSYHLLEKPFMLIARSRFLSTRTASWGT